MRHITFTMQQITARKWQIWTVTAHTRNVTPRMWQDTSRKWHNQNNTGHAHDMTHPQCDRSSPQYETTRVWQVQNVTGHTRNVTPRMWQVTSRKCHYQNVTKHIQNVTDHTKNVTHPEWQTMLTMWHIQNVTHQECNITFFHSDPLNQWPVDLQWTQRLTALWLLTSFTLRFSKAPWAACVARCSYTGLLCGQRRTMRPLRPVISATLSGPPSLSINSSRGLVHTYHSIRRRKTKMTTTIGIFIIGWALSTSRKEAVKSAVKKSYLMYNLQDYHWWK